DWQLTMLFAAIDQDGELHAFGTAKVDQLIKRRADRASGVKHVVNEYDVAVFDIARKVGAVNNRLGADGRKIVAIQRDVENADRWTVAFKVRDLVGHSFRERHTATAY